MTSPFSSYETPEIPDVFTLPFKQALLGHKMDTIAASVAASLLHEDNMEVLLTGAIPMKVRYNVKSIGTLGLIDDDSELDCLADAVKLGFKAVFEEIDNCDEETSIYIQGEYDEEDPDLAVISLTIIN
jgi:hypothetical protein